MVCIAGVLGNKQVALGPLAVEAGIFAFLLLGRDVELGRRASRAGDCESPGADRIRALLASLVLSLVVLALKPPAADGPPRTVLSAFDTMMTGTPRIWLGGICAYGVSTFLNVTSSAV